MSAAKGTVGRIPLACMPAPSWAEFCSRRILNVSFFKKKIGPLETVGLFSWFGVAILNENFLPLGKKVGLSPA